MDPLNGSDIGFGDQMPIVIVYGNGRQDSALACAQVSQALGKSRIDCIVLEGHAASLSMVRKQFGIGATIRTDRSLIEFSIVIPIFNEEDNISQLYRRLTKVMNELGEPYELIFVDDGSGDRSLEMLHQLHKEDPDHVCIIVLTRNFGHQRAISSGMDYSYGQAVVVMDADLQDPPEVIPQFIKQWKQGYQVVYAVREKRKEHILMRLLYHSFYLILRTVSRIEIPLEAGDYCLMDRCVVDAITSLPERNRFVRGLRSWVGFRQTGIAYERDARFAGESKYTFGKLVSLALDGLISFSYLPLRLSTILGFGVSVLSMLVAAYYVTKKLASGLGPPGFATQVVLIAFLGGIQLITLGIVGEYIGQVLDEVKSRPSYLVSKVIERNRVAPDEEV